MQFWQAQKKGFDGPRLGVKVADENKRNFTAEKLAESNKIIGLQYGSNRGASQAGMPAFGNSRKILPDGKSHKVIPNNLCYCKVWFINF